MRRRAILLAVLFWALAVSPGMAEGRKLEDAPRRPFAETDDALSPSTENRAGPASTPACASRTWWLCVRQRDPSLCATAGVTLKMAQGASRRLVRRASSELEAEQDEVAALLGTDVQ